MRALCGQLDHLVLLPIPNTSVEMLAELLADRLRAELDAAGPHRLAAIEMEVEESVGQTAVYRMVLTER